jgi:hypothetical protein
VECKKVVVNLIYVSQSFRADCVKGGEKYQKNWSDDFGYVVSGSLRYSCLMSTHFVGTNKSMFAA